MHVIQIKTTYKNYYFKLFSSQIHAKLIIIEENTLVSRRRKNPVFLQQRALQRCSLSEEVLCKRDCSFYLRRRAITGGKKNRAKEETKIIFIVGTFLCVFC